ncbi:hypothetical protein KEM54_000563 [Ascosphaera aggregata]|nr:hypothetical protein KEM54_000563 [Ascosphaera aggregata]
MTEVQYINNNASVQKYGSPRFWSWLINGLSIHQVMGSQFEDESRVSGIPPPAPLETGMVNGGLAGVGTAAYRTTALNDCYSVTSLDGLDNCDTAIPFLIPVRTTR